MSSEPDKGLKVVGWQKDGDDSFDRDVIIFDDGSLWKHDGNEWYRIWQPDFEPSEPTVDDPEPENIPRHWFVSPNPNFRNPDDVQRIQELEARVKELEAEFAAAKAEPVKLDPDRVIKTAKGIAYGRGMQLNGARHCGWMALYYALHAATIDEGWGEAKPYDLAE